MIGKKVLVEFNTETWPIAKATYTYEGHDEGGYYLRRKDGVQRYIKRENVVGITEVETDVAEPEF